MRKMEFSERGLELTKMFEGCRFQAYTDQVGVWTIGYGHTKGVRVGDVCTQQEADQLLREDVQECVDAINAHARIDLTQGEFDALVDFAFNLGVGALLKSTLWRKLNDEDYDGAGNEFPKWDMAGGRHIAGLRRRRLAEQMMFKS